MSETILWAAVVVILITSTGLIISRDWRVALILLAIQYFAMFILVIDHWPLAMAAAKLITGWMATALLGMNQQSLLKTSAEESAWPEGRLFKLLVSGLVILAVVSLSPNLLIWLPGINLPEAVGGAVLIGMGLLQLGITIQPLRVTFGLLTVLCGFEILYASIENSLMVAAMLSLINLSLALLGGYLMNAGNAPKEQE